VILNVNDIVIVIVNLRGKYESNHRLVDILIYICNYRQIDRII